MHIIYYTKNGLHDSRLITNLLEPWFIILIFVRIFDCGSDIIPPFTKHAYFVNILGDLK